jgi:hypothetical protein
MNEIVELAEFFFGDEGVLTLANPESKSKARVCLDVTGCKLILLKQKVPSELWFTFWCY